MTDSRSTVLTVDAQGHSIHITDSDLSLNQATLIANKNSIDLTQSTLLVQQELTLNAVEELVTDSATVLAESLNVQANRLSNRKGLIQQSGSPSLELQFAGNVDNTDGTILSNSELTIATDHLHNESGEISSAKALVLNVRSHVDNTQGIITSTDTATINSGEFNNDQGRIQSVKTLSIDTNGQALINTNSGNTAGVISGDGLDITASTLNNNAGYIGAQQTLDITTTADSSNVAGVIESADSLTLNTAAFNNDQGRLQSAQALSIDTNSNIFINTNSGNTAGVISGDGLDITASTLNNNAGYIGAQQTLSVTTTVDSSNVEGVIESADSLTLNTAAFNNDQGRIQSSKALSIDTNSNIFINTNSGNTAGVISGDGLDITASTLNNNAGYIGAQQTLSVTTTVDSSNVEGVIESADSLTLNTAAFNNDQGRIQSSKALSIDTNSNIFINTNSGNTAGVISGDGLDITASTLNNNAGYIGAQQTLSVTITVDSSNVAGVIESADSLTLNTAAFNNDQGRLQSAKALSIDTNGNMFTNTNSSNTAGVISGDGVDITAGSLNNDEGYIGSQKVLRVTSLGNYTNKSGIIESVEKILLEAETFNNDLGHIQSFDDVSIVTTGNASNVLGNIFASGDIGIRTAAFNNQQGLIQSNNNPNSPNSTYNISINTNNHVFNNAQTSINGGVVSSGEISLLASSVDNTTGYIGAKKNILLTANGSNSNRSGQIEAQQNLNFNSGELDNSGGSIRAKEDVLIATRVGTSLTNAYSGSNGGIRSGGYLNLSTDALNNTEGHIESSKDLAITARANTTNTLGKIISTEKLAINGRNINNHQGRIQSADDMNINTNGNTLTNTASGNDKGIISAGKLQITSGALNNSSGYIGALIQKMPNTSNQYQLQGADITIRSQGLTNSFGHVRSASDLSFTNTGSNTSLVNSSGFLVANKVLDIQDASSNKTFKISNTSGELTAGEQVKLNVQQLLGKGNVLSAGSILVNLVGDYVHQNDFVADTDLTLNVTGTLQNYNRLSANNTLNITSATLVNHNNAELSAINTNISVSGTLTNRGLIDATNDTSIQANRLNNYGTGRIYGDHVSIKANALYNYAESSKAAVIAARTELDLGVGTLGNSGGSLIYSDGSASIAGNIVGGQASGRAGTITNNNSTIEAAGTLSINANRLDNLSPGSYTIKTNGKVTTQSVRRLQRGILDNGSLHKVGAIYDVNGTNTYFDYRHGERQARIPTGQYDDYYDYVVTRTTTTPTVTRNNNLIAKVISGSNMSLIVGTVNNTYSNITAGGRISAQVASLKNAALTGTETTRDKGKIYGYYSADNYSVEKYTGPITSRTVSLSASVYQGSKNASTRYGISANQLSKKGADLSNNLTNRTVRPGFSAISLAVKDNSKTRRNNIGVAINASAQRNKSGVQRNNSQINGRENFQFTEIAGARGTIRSSNTVAIASNNSLFIQNTRPTATYLVETDPRFTSTRQYLSSELVTQQVAVSPNITNKRLGDGFYEQRIVREQIVELTGRRFLDNYSSDETQYQDLLNNGVSFAKAYNLRPGIALSERQMENLTQDIVWLEAQDVMLSNGTTQQVLVPKVYTVVSKGDLLPSGSLISGDSIDIASTGTIDNGGDFIARDGIALKAKDIKDLGGRLQAASATVNATNDIILEGSQWRVDDSLELTAGRDITMRTTSSTSDLGQEGTRTIANQRATLEVRDTNSSGRLAINAGRNTRLTAATVINNGTGDTNITAGNRLTLDTIKEERVMANIYGQESISTHLTTDISGQGNVTLRAGNSLRAQGADITAGQALVVDADTLEFITAENRLDSNITGGKKTKANDITHDLSRLTAGTDIILNAKKDLTLHGTDVTAGDNIALNAEGDIDISVAQDESYRFSFYEEKKSFGRKTTELKESFSTTNVGGNLIAGNNLTINSTINPDGTVTSNGVSGSVLIRGADVEASNSVAISGESVTIADQTEVDFKREETYKRGFGGLSSHHQGQTTRTELVDSADITANTQNLDLVSAKDITITGSNVIAGQETRLNAGQDIIIESAESTTTQTSFDHKSKFGLSLSGLTVSLGETKENVDTSTTSTSQVGSTVGSLNGNISIDAQRNATIAASDIIARGGDISVAADKVDIVQRDHVVETETKHEVSFSGVSAGLSGGAADSVNTMVSSGERIQHTDNDALKALHTWKVANAAQALPDQIDDLQNIGDDFNNLGQDVNKGATSGINLSISAGSNSSESHSTSTQRTARGGSLSAGGALNITARGDQAGNKDSGDITAQGAYLNGDTVTLNAKDDLILTSAENTSESNSTQSSRSAAVGLSIGSSGFNVYVEGSRSDGITEQSGDQYLETRIQGARQVTLISGDDTTLEGAEVRAEQITATVGGDLSITSQQDNNQFNQHSESRGGRLTYGTNSGASLNASETTATANFESVQEQSGLFAGEGGFDITVENNTALTGGVIASTATADNNTLSTNSLTTRNLENVSEYEIESKSVGVSVGGDSQGVSGGASGDDDHQESTTYNVISDGSIDIRNGDRSALAIVKNNEADATNALENTFSEDKVQDVQDTAEAVQIFGEEAYRIVGKKYEDLENAEAELAAAENTEGTSQERIDELKQEVQRQEDALPVSKEVAHAFVGGVSAIIGGGNVLQGAAAAGINEVAAQTIDDSLPSNAIARNALAVGVGSVVGGTEGALIAGSADRFNRQLHPTERKVIDELAKDWADSDGSISYEEARKRLALTAFGNVDGIGGLYTNDDVEANSILKNNGFSFVDGDGVERQAFTRDEDYWRPWTYLDQQNTPEGQAFYAENITPYLTTPSQDRTNRVLNEEYQKILDNLPKTENIKPDEFVLTYLSSSIVGGRVLIKDGRDYKETTDEQWESVYGSDNVADVKHVVQSAVLIGAAANTVTRRGVGVKDRSSDVPVNNPPKSNLVPPTSNPGTAQSRVNVAKVTDDNGNVRGFDYAINRHGADSTIPNKSRYSIPNDDVKSLLQESNVVKSPVYNLKRPDGTVDTERFVRQVDTGRTVGTVQDGTNTSVITIITNRQGELINTFPGTL